MAQSVKSLAVMLGYMVGAGNARSKYNLIIYAVD
jgi:hypothetical protein